MYRVIVVEDELIVRQGIILTTDWKSLDCEIIGEAKNGREGLDLITKLRPEIVITDISMPVLNGIDMSKKVLEIYNPAIIYLTAFSEFRYAKDALSMGAVDYIVKPFRDEELIESIERAKEQVKNQFLVERIKSKEETPLQQFEQFFSNSSKSKHQNIIKAMTIISDHYASDINIESVAEQLQVSKSYLSDLFKKETSYTFHEYLTNTRLKVACQLLEDPNYRIYEVAQRVGYRDQRYFSQVFKKNLGITPQEYKEGII